MSKKNSLLFTAIIILLGACKSNLNTKIENSDPQSNNSIDQKPKIAILGTIHLDTSNDYTSTQIDSLLSDKRQAELLTLVNKIQEFKPTKIMVEWEPDTKKRLDSELLKYLNGDFQLPKNEIYQIGFRLAKTTKLKEIYPVDYQMSLGDNDLVNYLSDINKLTVFEDLVRSWQKIASEETEYLKSHSILEYYTTINTKKYEDFNRNLYLEKIPSIAYQSNNPLIEYTANWYKRNIVIMANIDSHVEETDRILLLIGAGHKAVLKDLYSNRSNIEYVEILNYLK